VISALTYVEGGLYGNERRGRSMNMPTIAILGAGSTVFARQLMTDILLID
jgi:hypothetical protein